MDDEDNLSTLYIEFNNEQNETLVIQLNKSDKKIIESF
jgi:hypothetical protein